MLWMCEKPRGQTVAGRLEPTDLDLEFHQEELVCAPEYDTINPIYEMIPEPLSYSQNSLKMNMMSNKAYAERVQY